MKWEVNIWIVLPGLAPLSVLFSSPSSFLSQLNWNRPCVCSASFVCTPPFLFSHNMPGPVFAYRNPCEPFWLTGNSFVMQIFFNCYQRKLYWTLLPFFVLLRLFAGGEQLLIKSRQLLLLLPCSCLGTVSFLITADKKLLLFVERVCAVHVLCARMVESVRGAVLYYLCAFLFCHSVLCGMVVFWGTNRPCSCFRYWHFSFCSNCISA